MKYNFDEKIDRRGTNSLKYDFAVERGKPEGILPLWVADMDLRAPIEVRESLAEAAQHGIYGYSEVKAHYFEAVRDWMKMYHDWEVKPEWLIKTPGIVYAVAAAIHAFTKEGDGCMMQNPGYYSIEQVIKDNGRVLVENLLHEENGYFTMDFEDMERKIAAENVKMFILVNPHNPVGRVWSREELQRLGEICLKHDIIIISDEIHEDFVYPGHKHIVLAGMDERFRDITITCTAPSKTFNIAGLQVSNIFIANPEMMSAFKKEIDKTGYSQLNQMGLVACESAYRYGRDWLEQLSVYLQENLAFARSFIQENMSGVRLVEPEGTYFLWLDFRKLPVSDDELDKLIIYKAGLWLDSGRIFGSEGAGFQRINMACPRATLEEALTRLANALRKI